MLTMECHLEETVLEALLCELPEVCVVDVCIECSDEVLVVNLLPRPEVCLAISNEVNVAVDCFADPYPPQGCGGRVSV